MVASLRRLLCRPSEHFSSVFLRTLTSQVSVTSICSSSSASTLVSQALSSQAEPASPTSDEFEHPRDTQRLLQVAVIGAPNAGKSTLTNALVGQKVTAVSRKTNTTRLPTLGAFTEGTAQVVLYDTPGVVDSRHYKGSQHEQRVESAWRTAEDCDLFMFVIDAHRQVTSPDGRVVQLMDALRNVAEDQAQLLMDQQCAGEGEEEEEEGDEGIFGDSAGGAAVSSASGRQGSGKGALEYDGRQQQQQVVSPPPPLTAAAAAAAGPPRRPPSAPPSPLVAPPRCIVVLNKVDLLQGSARERQLQLTELMADIGRRLGPYLYQGEKEEEQGQGGGLFHVSALKGRGVKPLRQRLLDAATLGEWTMPKGAATDMARSQLAREMVREKLFEYLHQELPYELKVEHVAWTELPDGRARCEQRIAAPNKRVRSMVIGKGGETVGRIATAARIELEKVLGRGVELKLQVGTSK